MEKTLSTLEAFQKEAEEFVHTLSAKKDSATLVTLSGELGAGKTTFTQTVAKTLGVDERVTSPTFVLEKIYTLPKAVQGFTQLVHIDAYRLKSGAELDALGFEELMEEAHNLVLLEWPEQVADALPKADVAITLTVEKDTRIVSYV